MVLVGDISCLGVVVAVDYGVAIMTVWKVVVVTLSGSNGNGGGSHGWWW